MRVYKNSSKRANVMFVKIAAICGMTLGMAGCADPTSFVGPQRQSAAADAVAAGSENVIGGTDSLVIGSFLDATAVRQNVASTGGIGQAVSTAGRVLRFERKAPAGRVSGGALNVAGRTLPGGWPALEGRAQAWVTHKDDTFAMFTSSSTTGGMAVTQWNAVSRTTSIRELQAFVQREAGCTVRVDARNGFSTRYNVRTYSAKESLAPDVDMIYTAVPFTCTGSSRFPGVSGVFAIVGSEQAPDLRIPRLAIRWRPSDSWWKEYQVGYRGRVMEMTAKFGDALAGNSAMWILDRAKDGTYRRFEAAERELRGRPLIETQRRFFDVRMPHIGQHEALVYTALLWDDNLEEEFNPATVSSRLDANFIPRGNANEEAKLAFKIVKEVLKEVLKKVLKAISCKYIGVFC